MEAFPIDSQDSSNGVTPAEDKTRIVSPCTALRGVIGNDLMMIDRRQADLFGALGGARSPFSGIAGWPTLAEVCEAYSRRFLKAHGQVEWEAAGGERGDGGAPTCRLVSPMAVQAVRHIVDNGGGLLWQDRDGVMWAVRLVPSKGLDKDSLFGFSISWNGSALPLDPRVRDEYEQAVNRAILAPEQSKLKKARRALDTVARQLRLYTRAAQMLWAIHQAVVSQRCSTVLLPDVLLGQLIWGGARASWPSDWRGEIMSVLKSLMSLRSEVLRLSPTEWKPRVGAASVAVAGVRLLGIEHPEEDICRDCCPLNNSQQRHSHIVVQVGLGFLGVLENFMTEDVPWGRTFDFVNVPEGDRGKLIQDARKTGAIVTVNAPVALLGPAKWSPLKGAPARILQALIRETTRARRRNRSESGKPQLVKGNLVPGTRLRVLIKCSLLKANGRYVVFGGNGSRAGMGYMIVGKQGTGWLARCGYEVPEDIDSLRRTVKDFLADLHKVAELLGLVVVGFQPSKQQTWLSIDELCSMAGSPGCWSALTAVHLRIYAPEDYLERMRACLEKAGGFEAVCDANSIENNHDESNIGGGLGADLAMEIARLKIRQKEIAMRAGITQSSVSQFLNGRRPWPDRVRKEIETMIVAKRQAQTMP